MKKRKLKKVPPNAILGARIKALQNALEKGYITQEEYTKAVNKPLKPKRKKILKKKPLARIYYGLNTNAM